MSYLLDRLRAALGGRYELAHELGRGGMATVFLGRDPRLGRPVAIKVFEHAATSPDGAERFLREVRIAAQLQHPHILPVFESGESDGLVYYVMPYVPGATLRERLEREGALPVAEAVRIAREVAAALDHAHRAGIVHRDIKPENILLADGVAVVADFGIARAAAEAGQLTERGLALGTPAYMSPEQATASPQIDGRSDVYALGCVLYELLAGTPPFTGPSGQAVMARHTADQVPPLSRVREVPAALERVVTTALAKSPADRWPTAAALARALDTVTPAGPGQWRWRGRFALLTAGSALAAVTALSLLAVPRRSSVPNEPRRSVAVLPFSVTGDAAPPGLGEGLMEAIVTGLTRIGGLRIPSPARVLALGERLTDPVAVARELGVGTVVTGTVRAADQQLRLTVQLVDGDDGLVVFSELFDADMTTVFEVQDSLTGKVVDALRLRLAPAERSALAGGRRTTDLDAYRLYLEARRAMNDRDGFSRAGAARAIALLEQAIAMDSSYADAWALLSYAIRLWGDFGGGVPATNIARARDAVRRAIVLDSLNPFAMAQYAGTELMEDWRWDDAWNALRTAVRRAPSSSDVVTSYAQFLGLVNQPDSVLFYARVAAAIDPSPTAISDLAAAYQRAGELDSAIVVAERAAAMDTASQLPQHVLMTSYLAAGRRAEAYAAAERFIELSGPHAWVLREALHFYRKAGDVTRARQLHARLVAIDRTSPVDAGIWAVASLAIGDRARALDRLEESLRRREPVLPWVLRLKCRPLHGEPRFQAVYRAVFGDLPQRITAIMD